MEYDELMSENSFRWPAVDDINNYEYENIISSIEAPRITGVSAKTNAKMCTLSLMTIGVRQATSLMNLMEFNLLKFNLLG